MVCRSAARAVSLFRLLAGPHEVSVAPLLLALFARSPAYGRVRALDAAIETPLSIGMLVFERRISEFEEKILFAAHTFEIVDEAHARLSAQPESRCGERSRSTGRGVINRQA
jgi:hypothetical protein